MRREITHAVEIARHYGPIAGAASAKLSAEGLALAATIWLIGWAGGAVALAMAVS